MATMTRQEAIDFLKTKKVYVDGKSAEIQKKLFELGWKWADGSPYVHSIEKPFIYIHTDNTITCGIDAVLFTKSSMTKISADEIISITIIESFKENDIVVSGWDEQDGRHCEWIAIVGTFNPNNTYTSKVILFTIKDSNNCPDIRYNSNANSQEWTRPATKKERRLLINKLKQENCHESRKILKEVFGIEDKFEYQFKPFDKVLVRNTNSEIWIPEFFYKKTENTKYPYCVISRGIYKQCIPYEGNEHLMDTTNSPK